MSLSDNLPVQDLIDFFYEVDAKDFELAVTAIILLGRVRKRSFKRNPGKQWVCTIFKERKEKVHTTNL